MLHFEKEISLDGIVRIIPHTRKLRIITTPLLGKLIQFARAKQNESMLLGLKSRGKEGILVIFTERLAFVFRNIRVLL